MQAVKALFLCFAASAGEQPIIKVVLDNRMADKRQLSYARGSSACWGIPGLAPQMDGSINVVPDETNLACSCSHSTECNYYQHLLMPLYVDSKLDVFHRHEELIGQVKFAAVGKNISGKVQWKFQCSVIDPDSKHQISCDVMESPDPSMYFLAYKVSLTTPTDSVRKYLPVQVDEEPIIKVDIENRMTDKRELRFARGSSSCWGVPGLAPQMDGSVNVVPDEGNFACSCSDHTTCDYYQHLLMPLYLDSKLDIFHRHNELIGQIKFAGLGRNLSGKVQWTFECLVIDADATHKISCNKMASPDPLTYFLAYKVSLTSPADSESTNVRVEMDEKPIIKVDIENNMTDKRELRFARGSSSCWGIPGLAPQMDGSINVVPDEGNLACPCSDHTTCDYYQHLLMPLYLDSKLDIFHRHNELIGQVKFAGLGRNISGKVQWAFECLVIDADVAHKISCDKIASPEPSTYFLAYKVSLTEPSGDASTGSHLNLAEKPIIKVDIENKMTDKRQLRFARGSSSCWGIPGLAPQMDGSINVVPDESNLACPCSDYTTCDYYQHLLMPLYLDSKLDIFHRHNVLIGQVKFAGLGKNVSGKVQWTFACLVINPDGKHTISCDETASPDPSLYFLSYKVGLTSHTTYIVV